MYHAPNVAKGGEADFCVPAKTSTGVAGELTIGYGEGNSDEPRCYFLRKNQSVDVGFLKLFLSTRWINYTDIAQDSPFENARGDAVHKSHGPLLWDSVTILVVQRSSTVLSSK